MKTNMGMLDRSLRVLAAIVLAVLTYTGTITGNVAIAAWVVSAIFVLTSVVSFCPIYRVIGIDTCQTR